MDWVIETLSATVDKEVENLPDELKPHFARTMELIRQIGLERMGMPHVRHLRGPIREIRFHGRSAIGRALYATVAGRRIVILRVFVKKTQKTPPREIALALKRMESLQA
jgi:phage-related protein